MPEGEVVHLELTNHVLTITMDRPEARNALAAR
jgi:enoyl-CoA hydratase/carnithine racemase